MNSKSSGGNSQAVHVCKSPHTLRIVLITSLFWVFVDAFLILYLIDANKCPEPKIIYREAAQAVKQQDQEVPHSERIAKNLKELNEQNIYKFRDDKSPNYPYTTPNDNNNLMKKLKLWFKEESSEKKNPSHWPGENGRPVQLPQHLKAESKRRFKENQFDIVISDMIALNRSLQDQRSEACKNREYPVNLPTTSIIIVHHNEGNTTLLRGLTSICNKSPTKYLKEIILVDDCSENRPYLGKPLDEFVKTLPVPVKIFRNKKRMGLMRSRLVGAKAATGDTMTFLDAHIECTDGWLPPLLTEIKHNRRTIVSPIIDSINDENFGYYIGDLSTWGGFDHKMIFTWYKPPRRELERIGYDNSMPYVTPTMAGGLFTIDRQYFYDLGAYDEGMDIWGSENLELSFRAWMCGGNLLITPCSHVGHIFRKVTPYTFPGGVDKVIYRNTRRLIDVWTDEYAEYFHQQVPELLQYEAGDITERLQLKDDLKCKSFKWYLTHIYPEAPVPIDFYHVGAIRNIGVSFCVDTMGRKKGDDIGAAYCTGNGGNQLFEHSKKGQIKQGDVCLDTRSKIGVVKFVDCLDTVANRNPIQTSQQWDYNTQHQYFRNRKTNTCLAINEQNNNAIVTINCDENDPMNKWELTDKLFQ